MQSPYRPEGVRDAFDILIAQDRMPPECNALGVEQRSDPDDRWRAIQPGSLRGGSNRSARPCAMPKVWGWIQGATVATRFRPLRFAS